MSINTVREKLRTGAYTAKDMSSSKGFTSDVWKKFSRIYEKEIPLEFVICNFCKQIYSYSKPLGTSGMHRHKCNKTYDNLKTLVNLNICRNMCAVLISESCFLAGPRAAGGTRGL